MLEAGRGEMGQVLVLYGVALGAQLRNHFLHIDGVPDRDGVGEQVQTANDLLLGFFLLAAQHAIAPEPEPTAQRVQLLAFG